jgi:hypothetical protein
MVSCNCDACLERRGEALDEAVGEEIKKRKTPKKVKK